MSQPLDNLSSHQAWIARSALLSALLVTLAFWVGMTWAEEIRRVPATSGPYRGITKVEVFTNWDTQLKLPKNPPYALLVYRMDAYHAMNRDLESKTPRGLSYDQKKAWQDQYAKDHRAEMDRWMDMVGSAFAGGERLKQYGIRFRVDPGIVINDGKWATQGSADIDLAIAQYQKEHP